MYILYTLALSRIFKGSLPDLRILDLNSRICPTHSLRSITIQFIYNPLDILRIKICKDPCLDLGKMLRNFAIRDF